MYDLETLERLNRQAVIRQRMLNGDFSPVADYSAQSFVFPLTWLAFKLRSGPPSLVKLVDIIENYGSTAEFLGLVREFLPDYETEIMAHFDDADRIRNFARRFNNTYFPLSDSFVSAYDDMTLGDFTHHLPVDLFGFSYDDYHDFVEGSRAGLILMLALIESPYDEEARIPILEEAIGYVGKEIIQRVGNGWSTTAFHRMLDGTEYEGAADVADWVWSNTECMVLNATYYEYEVELWSREIVDQLTEEWPRVIVLQDRMVKTYEWLEEDMHGNFTTIVDMLSGMSEEGYEPEEEYEPPVKIPDEQIPLPLDSDAQVYDY